MAGYSGTPLAKKLGIKDGMDVALINAPPGAESWLDGLPDDATIKHNPADRSGVFGVIVLFSTGQSHLRQSFPVAAKRLIASGGLWVAWPKRTSGAQTDLTEDIVRAIGLDAGLVDNKVCAIDETWSGLRFVTRLKDRPRMEATAKRGARAPRGGARSMKSKR